MSTETPSNCWRDVNGNPSTPSAHPFRATLYFADAREGMHGWSSRSQVFATLDEALAVLVCRMGPGVMRVVIDVAKNRKTWLENGRWERIASRKRSQTFKWGKGWNEARMLSVREHFEKR